MKEGVTFTMGETIRYGVIQVLLEKKMKNTEAALGLGLSVRQVQRIKKRVAQQGPEGILHGNKGRRPSNSFSIEKKGRIVKLTKERYFDFNFSHLSEILEEEEGFKINRETLRQWLRPLGFGGKVRKQPHHRKRRKRSSREGALLFLDGSPHLWFGTEPSTLILATDDATVKCAGYTAFLQAFILIVHPSLPPHVTEVFMLLKVIKDQRNLKEPWENSA
ncbi:MAG: helix-turn-helix domain-containing protein [Deltaproteobacteria bacterium]|nr:helix-turn-helix domain-containing protein [Deltaproteobacteria bacterium]